ncbi:hypothetical protein KEU06_10960 [Pseudaminobacter sp. 19-2017]|uniref:Type VII secretion system protein EssD-like domain-containing protein n=1 Tax=Pseudaminobacter soli (ex Zhang et al. 2022) TaxID=2831468 RepID=A0A942I262_9HYPH|nr:hypothetical protein [Pseudaminobacter soli]MBS3649127.1 hypothetical protein [Pseudaminobacter soli]
MVDYSKLRGLFSSRAIEEEAVPWLIAAWLDNYDLLSPDNEIVETTTGGFSYLFDVQNGRLLAAWGFSLGRHAGARDKARMAGHPRSGGELYHRGHAIPHTLGGPIDINLVPQLGSVNVGPFRELEKKAVATPGALYFTYWRYGNAPSQMPIGVDQGLLVPGKMPEIKRHGN